MSAAGRCRPVVCQQLFNAYKDRCTVSELRVFGTAISNSSAASSSPAAFATSVRAKEQKFMVLTCRMCRSHGCFRGSGGVSTGRTTLMDGSSSTESFQTTSLLSFPCL